MDKITKFCYEEWKKSSDRIEEERSLFKELFKYARHSTYCSHMLNEKNDCNCGFNEVLIKWLNR